jgi:hypothetical protein
MIISQTTARRFVLGRQGLWPGRRWAGPAGTAEALRAAEAVQLDPLNVVARSHDIALWGRVLDYRPEHLDGATYGERAFFDYGGNLHVYPMAELPFWRLPMRRRAEAGRWANFAAEHAALLDEVRAELRERGPLGNRGFTGRARVDSYRGRKDTGPALFCLWITGEVMIHHRQGFERVYDFRERVAPPELDYAAPDAEAEEFLAAKVIAFMGLMRERAFANGLSNYVQRRVEREEAQGRLERLAAPVQVEGSRERWWALPGDLPLLSALEAGGVPQAWQPLQTTTQEEVIFLAPLDIVSARGRAARLFDFEYVWEVYKPVDARRWGYYTLPILYGDRLVARLDPKLDRAAAALVINGFWLEEDAPAGDPAFGAALARGLARFAAFLDARQIDISAITPPDVRAQAQDVLSATLEVQARE